MITIGMNYDVLEGKEHQFESVFKSVLEIMKEMEGHGKSALFKDVLKPNAYLIVSEWTDEHAFRAFTASEQFKKVTDWGKEQILSGRPHHEIYGSPEPPLATGGCPVAHAAQ